MSFSGASDGGKMDLSLYLYYVGARETDASGVLIAVSQFFHSIRLWV